MAMLLFLLLLFIVFLIMLWFVLQKLSKPIDKRVKTNEYKKEYITSVKYDIAIKEREIDMLSRSTELQSEKQQTEKELKELKELHKKITENKGEN